MLVVTQNGIDYSVNVFTLRLSVLHRITTFFFNLQGKIRKLKFENIPLVLICIKVYINFM